MIEWKEVSLKKYCKTQYGYTASATDINTGVKFVRITDITPDFIEWEKVPYCSISKSDFEKYRLNENDIVVARTGATVGYAKQIRKGTPDAVFASYLVKLIPSENIDRNFLGILIESNVYKDFIQIIAGGSAQPNANANDLTLFKFYLPPLHAQQRIATIITTYKDLIEVNNQRIKLLEETARELYKEWFVRMRFPGFKEAKFVKGVPEGWKVEKLGQVIELAYGKALKEEDRVEGPYLVYGSSGIVGTHTSCIAKAPGIVVGRKGNVGSVFLVTKDFYPIDTAFYVNTKISLYYTYFNLQLQHFIEGDAAVPGLNRNQAYSNFILIPSEDILKMFDITIKPIFEMVSNLNEQNTQLQQIRDRLLPRLISGKLEVKNIE
jgi:type I restriction enzyme S subunit